MQHLPFLECEDIIPSGICDLGFEVFSFYNTSLHKDYKSLERSNTCLQQPVKTFVVENHAFDSGVFVHLRTLSEFIGIQ